MQLDGLDLLNLSRYGIRKKKAGHDFVYRYPPSVLMPKFDHKAFLSSLDDNKREVALYVHIPFCSKACFFCHYFKIPSPSDGVVKHYLEHLKKEISFYGELLSNNVKITSVFFGGGTPTFLDSGQMEGLMNNLKEIFDIPKHIESTIESSPETLDNRKISSLLDMGFNRLSMGVQSFDDRVNKISGRGHTSKQAGESIKGAKEAGFKDVNIDLIYGLPGQNISSWQSTLQKSYGLGVDSVTASELRVLPNSAFYSQQNKLNFVSENDMLKMHIKFMEYFIEKDYLQIFPYQFVRKGRNFEFLETQWSNNEFIGLGASSCSYLNGWDYNNNFPLKQYSESVDRFGFSAVIGKKLNKGEQMIREIVLGLKKSGVNRDKQGVSKKEFLGKYDVNLDDVFSAQLKLLDKLKLIGNNKERLFLSKKGLLFADEVAKQFYQSEIKKKLANVKI